MKTQTITKLIFILVNMVFFIMLFMGAVVNIYYRMIVIGFGLTLIYWFILRKKTNLTKSELPGTAIFLATITVGIIWILINTF